MILNLDKEVDVLRANTKEKTDSIEKFRNYSSKDAGVYLPSPNEDKFLDHIKNEMERYKVYL